MSKLLGALNGLTVLHGGDDAAVRARVVAVAALRKKTRSSAVVGKTRGKRRVLRIRRSRSVRRCRRRPAEERCRARRGGRTLGKLRGRCSRRSRSACRRCYRPAEGNEVERGEEGGRGANFEVVFVAGHGQLVVAVAALRKEIVESGVGRTRGKRRGCCRRRSRSACRRPSSPAQNATIMYDRARGTGAGQTSRLLKSPVAISVSSPSSPCGRKRSRERWRGRTQGKRRGGCRRRRQQSRRCHRIPVRKPPSARSPIVHAGRRARAWINT